jgi:hypothetical protein
VNPIRGLAALLAFGCASAALAGPPYLTDDPVPTDTGHWEIYAPQFQLAGSGSDFDGSFGAEINYGPLPAVQLTVDLPAAFSRSSAGWRWGAGDIAASVKYRFFRDERSGLQIAAFPGVTLPTAANGLGVGRVTALLPIWAQEDLGRWSVFGGGGYAVNPGRGNRDFWEAGIAVTHDFGRGASGGVELFHRGPDMIGGSAETDLGVGTILHVSGPASVLLSGGPSWTEHRTGYHAYAALGLNF